MTPAATKITREDLERLPYIEAADEDSGETVRVGTQPRGAADAEGRLISFVYEGNLGRRSTRVVLCSRCWFAGALYLRGFCLERQAMRTFRADRMFDCHDIRSGEAFGAEDFVRVHAGLPTLSKTDVYTTSDSDSQHTSGMTQSDLQKQAKYRVAAFVAVAAISLLLLGLMLLRGEAGARLL